MSDRAELDRLVDGALAVLDLEARVRLVTGETFWSTVAVPDAGLRRIVLSDGPAGVRGELWDERDPSRNLPSPTALAATWDPVLVEALGRLLAAEARRKGVDVVLAPTINLHRSPLGGRHFECFSEDPLLTAVIGGAEVRGLQAGGVAACAKHLVANDSETDRMTVDVVVDERTLHELLLAPFEALVRDAGAWSVMAAYNGVNGRTMTESPLLDEPLKAAWGFEGPVVSDWFAVRSVEASARTGTDLAMPGPWSPWADGLLDAVRDGRVPADAVQDKVRRILRLAGRVGALEGAAVAPAPVMDSDAEVALLRRAAATSMVLLRNEPADDGRDGAPLLPLDPGRLTRVAVLGPNAAAARTQGGGSATVLPEHVVSPLEGLRAALPGAEVVHADGVRLTEGLEPIPVGLLADPETGEPGVRTRYLDAGGQVVRSEARRSSALVWNGTPGYEGTVRLELTARFTPERTGTYRLGVAGLGPATLAVDGREVLAVDLTLPEGADAAAALLAPPEAGVELTLAAGTPALLTVGKELVAAPLVWGSLTLGYEPPRGTREEELAAAAALASGADVAVVVVGTTEAIESEGFDRSSLELPGGQDELVRRVAAANPRTVVVVNTGGPVLTPWADGVPATLLAWFPGERCGDALAQVLLGEVEPGGRMPTTWPGRTEDVPVLDTRPVDGTLVYEEGIHIGARAWLRSGAEPAWWFGHGLGYTTWRYDALDVPAEVGSPGDGPVEGRCEAAVDARVTVTVTNTGPRPGREVVQVYLARSDSSVDRPVRWLAGWAVVEAAPGERRAVEVVLDRRAFAHWSVEGGGWMPEPGRFEVLAGRSVADLPLAGTTEVVHGLAAG